MKKQELKRYSKTKNRLGYKNFIKDHQKMSDDYEKFLNWDDEEGHSWIDGMDHYFIATVNELGIRKEMEIKALKKEIKKLYKICNEYDELIELNDSIGGC